MGGGSRLEAMLTSDVANETADKLKGNVSGTGEGTGDGDGEGDKESVRRDDEAAETALLRPTLSSLANRP